jgi:hypothetical protein
MKPTYHVLAISLDENFEAKYKTSDKPFGFAPLDTIYGHDFNVLVYVDAATQPMDAFDILMVTGAAAQEICRATGMIFRKFEFPKPFSECVISPLFEQYTPQQEAATLQPTKLTYHVLLTPTPNAPHPHRYDSATYKKPFGFAPCDTLYGQDFDVMVYVDDHQCGLDFDEIISGACLAASEIEKETGMFFLDWGNLDVDFRPIKKD